MLTSPNCKMYFVTEFYEHFGRFFRSVNKNATCFIPAIVESWILGGLIEVKLEYNFKDHFIFQVHVQKWHGAIKVHVQLPNSIKYYFGVSIKVSLISTEWSRLDHLAAASRHRTVTTRTGPPSWPPRACWSTRRFSAKMFLTIRRKV